MRLLRDWDAICEEGNEGVLWSEVMEEEVILLNVWLLLRRETEYLPSLKGTSRNGESENEMYFVEKWKLFQQMNSIRERFDLIAEDII